MNDKGNYVVSTLKSYAIEWRQRKEIDFIVCQIDKDHLQKPAAFRLAPDKLLFIANSTRKGRMGVLGHVLCFIWLNSMLADVKSIPWRPLIDHELNPWLLTLSCLHSPASSTET